jgi:hypothetical protein
MNGFVDQGIRQAQLQYPYAKPRQLLEAHAQVSEGLDHIEVGLSGTDHADVCTGTRADAAVETIVAGVGASGHESIVHHEPLLVGNGVGSDGGQGLMLPGSAIQHETVRIAGVVSIQSGIDTSDPVGDGGDDLQADPATGVAGKPEGMDPEIEHVLLIGRVEHRDAGIFERVLAVARQRRRLGRGIVATEQNHATVGSRPHRVPVLEDVTGTVQAGCLAVPDADHAVDAGVGDGRTHLTAPGGGRRHLLVEPRTMKDSAVRE